MIRALHLLSIFSTIFPVTNFLEKLDKNGNDDDEEEQGGMVYVAGLFATVLMIVAIYALILHCPVSLKYFYLTCN